MSEQAPTPQALKPESSEPSAEQVVDVGKYEANTPDIIEAANNLNPMQRQALMRQFLDGIMAEADAGAIKTSKGDVLTSDMMRKQLSSLLQGVNQPDGGINPLRFIPSAEGLRASIYDLLSNESTAQALLDAIQNQLRNPEAYEVRSAYNLKEVGGKTVEAAGIIEPSVENVKDDLTLLKEKFNTDDLLQLRSYAQSKQDERNIHAASRAGKTVEPGSSQDAAHSAVWALSQMSPAAKEAASQYDRLFNRK